MITQLDSDFSQLSAFINHISPSAIFFLVDENTHEHCLPSLLANLETAIPFEIIETESGEEMKTLETAAQIWEILADFRTDRNALIINLGGGVITDLGAFVASTFKRGINFIHIPTTLLAMCDASLGGKTGIDFGNLKNIVGTFADPLQVFLYPQFLETLPDPHLRSGFAEMLKHGIIADKNHFNEIKNLPNLCTENLVPHIQYSMQIKQSIVQQDYREKNIRKTLNYGHTVGHAIESCFLEAGKPVPHGEAVAAGMICEAELAFFREILNDSDLIQIINTVDRFFPRLDISDFSLEKMLSFMKNDKKNMSSTISFSVPERIGSCLFDQQFSDGSIRNALVDYQSGVF